MAAVSDENLGVLPSRRHFLWQAGGLGGVALAWLLQREGRSEAPVADAPSSPHFAPKANRVILIFCPGGMSHVDTFDYKPGLAKHDGQQLPGKPKLDTFFG